MDEFILFTKFECPEIVFLFCDWYVIRLIDEIFEFGMLLCKSTYVGCYRYDTYSASGASAGGASAAASVAAPVHNFEYT